MAIRGVDILIIFVDRAGRGGVYDYSLGLRSDAAAVLSAFSRL